MGGGGSREGVSEGPAALPTKLDLGISWEVVELGPKKSEIELGPHGREDI